MHTGFFAYPESTGHLRDAIDAAVAHFSSGKMVLKPWKKMRIFGLKVDDVVRAEIGNADFVLADVTYPNPNVFYEFGYAIAKGIPVVPTIHSGVDKSVSRMSEIGLFDTIGWIAYNNGQELISKLELWEDNTWTNSYIREKNHAQPLFILDSLIKTDFRNHIFQAVENSKVQYRSFDPVEVPRLTAAQAIGEVSSSAGIIVPIINSDIVDSQKHNLRASFVLGLAHGFEIKALAIQYEHHPVPLDYRDFITNSNVRRETEAHVSEFAQNVLVWNQLASNYPVSTRSGLISKINLGSPAAENEINSLVRYFVKTAEYSRAIRAEGAIVIGRKGSGKTAIYFQVSDRLRKERKYLYRRSSPGLS